MAASESAHPHDHPHGHVHDVGEGHICSADVRLAMLRRTPLFGRLTDQELIDVNARCRAEPATPGQVVHHEGEPAGRLYVVATGTVKLKAHDEEGRALVRDLIAPGEIFGALQALGDDRYRDEAEVLRPGCLLVLSAETFRELLVDIPGVAVAALELTASRLREARETAQELATLPVDRRLASTLLRLADKVGTTGADGVALEVALSQQDLAAMTGTTPESVSRTFRTFRERGLLQAGRARLLITDLQGLQRVSDGSAG